MKDLKKLNKYFLKYKYHFFGGILITIASQIFMIYTPKYVGQAINSLQDFTNGYLSYQQTKEILYQNILWIVATTLIAGFLTFLMRQTIIVMSRNIEFDLKNEIFKHYEKLTQDFYKRNQTGDLMSRITEDVSKVRQYVGPAIMYSINTIIRFVVVIVQMYLISPTLTIYSLLPLPLFAYLIFSLSKQINKRSYLYQQNLSKLSSFSQEVFSGIRVLKAYSLEKQRNKQYKKVIQESKNIYMRLALSSSLIGPLLIFLIGICNLLIIFIGAKMYMNNQIENIGIIAQFILYINLLTWPIASLGWVSTMIQEASSSQKRLNEFLDIEPSIQNFSKDFTSISGKIEFKDVCFTYSDTQIKALERVSFSINKGQCVAILGKTGSGKSTLLNLIPRLYTPDSGNVLIDDIPVEKHHLQSLRQAIAVVPQDAFLFSDSIKNNIAFGKENATVQEIEHYATLADVHKNIIAFENGYHTVLGERGLTLSGGQKQRISIARALIKQAPILLLDDCLSAVDTETEEQIIKNLKEVTQGKTTLMVTHRISAAQSADFILILEDGKIIEKGTHQQLLNFNGYYASLFEKQLSEKELI